MTSESEADNSVESVVVAALTYHLFVRATAIGELLNGRRYPRSLQRFEPPPTVRVRARYAAISRAATQTWSACVRRARKRSPVT